MGYTGPPKYITWVGIRDQQFYGRVIQVSRGSPEVVHDSISLGSNAAHVPARIEALCEAHAKDEPIEIEVVPRPQLQERWNQFDDVDLQHQAAMLGSMASRKWVGMWRPGSDRFYE